jgi:Mn2+/Fe2+ NRAMP family transporter
VEDFFIAVVVVVMSFFAVESFFSPQRTQRALRTAVLDAYPIAKRAMVEIAFALCPWCPWW